MVARKSAVKKSRVPKTRGNNTMTEAGYYGWIRSSLRRLSQRWPPLYSVLKDHRRAATPGDTRIWGNRIRWTYQCSRCLSWMPKKEVEVDHIIPAGSIKCHADIGPFVERLLCERDGLRLVCKPCHLIITASAKENKNAEG